MRLRGSDQIVARATVDARGVGITRPRKSAVAIAVAAALGSGAVPLGAAPEGGAWVGPEFQVNTAMAGEQFGARVAVDADGDSVIVWQSAGQDGAGYGIYAQRYNAAGAPQAAEFRVNTFTTGNQLAGSVAMAADGSFVVAWSSANQAGASSGADIYAQRYDTSGVPQGAEFLVNTTTANVQGRPRVAMDADGDFIVTWHHYVGGGGVLAQRYSAVGAPQGGAFQVNTSPGATWDPTVAMDADGDFVIAWTGLASSGLFESIVRRYDAAGVAAGEPATAHMPGSGSRDTTVISMDADGDVVVAWNYAQLSNGSFGPADIRAQRLAGSENVDLSLAVTAVPDPVAAGANLSYDLTVHNLHMAQTPTAVAAIDTAIGTGTGIRLDPSLPSGFNYVGAAGSDWNCINGSGGLRCDYDGVLAPGASTTVSLTAQAAVTAGQHSLAALVAGGQFDANESSAGSNNEATATVQVAGASSDTTPDAFAFTDQTDVAASMLVTSNAVTVSSIDAAASIAVIGGEYSVNGAAFTSAAGTVSNGDTVRVRHTSSATPATAVNTTLTIGGVSDTFTSTTAAAAADTTPDAFNFTDQTNATAASVMTSNTITVSGINAAASISITGGEYSVNGGAFTSAPGTVSAGNTVAVRVMANATASGTASATLTIGGVSDTFTVTTQAEQRRGGGGAFGAFDLLGLAGLLATSLGGLSRTRRRMATPQ